MRQNLLKNSCLKVMMLVVAAIVVQQSILGCSNKEQKQDQISVVKPVAVINNQQVKAVQKPVSSALKLTPPPVVNQFDFSTKKDPFKPYALIKTPAAATNTKSNDFKSALPIHSFDVSQFKLIGIITGGKENQAMVTDPNGKGYVLKSGMSIGKNEGRIISVTNSGVEILEQFRDDNGRVRKENIKITLPRKQ